MHGNESWIAMFRRLPVDLHDVMAVGITTGDEIVLQRILKLEPEFMIILGRLAGTQDNGRLIIIAYAQLTYMAISRKLMDNEIQLIFGKDTEGFAPPIGAAKAERNLGEAAEPEPQEEQEIPVYEVPTVSQQVPVNLPGNAPMPSKTTLLAKLRARLGENGHSLK
jgi:hypothetical protein